MLVFSTKNITNEWNVLKLIPGVFGSKTLKINNLIIKSEIIFEVPIFKEKMSSRVREYSASSLD